jgi:hypothetical protein
MAGRWMTDEELSELTRGFVSLLQPYLANPATPDRARRLSIARLDVSTRNLTPFDPGPNKAQELHIAW